MLGCLRALDKLTHDGFGGAVILPLSAKLRSRRVVSTNWTPDDAIKKMGVQDRGHHRQSNDPKASVKAPTDIEEQPDADEQYGKHRTEVSEKGQLPEPVDTNAFDPFVVRLRFAAHCATVSGKNQHRQQ